LKFQKYLRYLKFENSLIYFILTDSITFECITQHCKIHIPSFHDYMYIYIHDN
jgi:hypothetical protein